MLRRYKSQESTTALSPHLSDSGGRQFLLEPWDDTGNQKMEQIRAEAQRYRTAHVTADLGKVRGFDFLQVWLVEPQIIGL